ncbi:ESCRT-II complex, vps25 subunit [Atractiella rhizophila]|nr:ESCRT-II complex, vps25 subunit [Atractiella rhizophila]
MQANKFILPIHVSSSGFTFPDLYSWDPFFTKQRNASSQAHQLAIWSQLILSYCRFHRLFRLDITEGAITGGEAKELWGNEKTQRRVSLAFADDIIQSLVAAGSAAYDSPSPKTKSSSVFIYWRRPEEWGEVIYHWIVENGLGGTIMTFYELTTGGTLAHTTEFHLMPYSLLRRSLQGLIKQGKAQVFKDTGGGGEGEEGAKFF